MNQLQLAESIARKAHAGQTRRDGVTPYIKHVEKVVSLVGDNKVLQCIAWLHDVIEDTKYTLQRLIDLGVEMSIVNAVDILTHKKNWSYTKYINEIIIQGEESIEKVKIADIVANLTDKPTPKQIDKYVQALNILAKI